MKDKLSSQAKELLKVFPEIPISMASELDIEIKKKIMAYQPKKINEDTSTYIRTKVIKEYVNSKNSGKIKKKCNKLASEYLENERQWILQENWFCILAYIITIVTMICRVLEINTFLNDIISFCMYFLGVVAWLGLVGSKRFMGKKAEIFLSAFNHHAPSLTMVSSLLFYLVLLTKKEIAGAVVIGLSVAYCGWITILWYKRLKNVQL